MCWYYKFLVRRPYFVVFGVSLFSLTCIIVSLTTKDWPDFSEPTLGFEARGTVLGNRLTAWRNLQRSSNKIVADPNDLLAEDEINSGYKIKHNKKKKNSEKKKNKIKTLKNLLINETSIIKGNVNDYGAFIRDYDEINDTNIRKDHYDYGKNMSYINEEDNKEIIQIKKNKWMKLKNFESENSKSQQIHLIADGFFCQPPDKEFSHFVIERINNNNDENSTIETLFEINSLLSICQLEHEILEVKQYEEYCQKELFSNNCCKPWSLPNYIALLSNKTSCFDIDQNDVITVQNLLLNCFEYFHSLKLSNDCQEYKCRAPSECIRHNAVYNILHYLTDINFIQANSSNIFLKYAVIFIPIAKSTKILDFFHNLEKRNLKNELVNVVAMDLGLKNALFDESLVMDGWLVGLGGIFVMTCIWIYTSSVFITIMTVLAVFYSLGIAYFVYMIVLDMTFFPFMNLLAVVVLIGVGADDAFLFIKIWESNIAEGININDLMAITLCHTATSMFVTSITTAGAFYASYISSITAVKCFGIFAGTAILINYLLMITWLPASISIIGILSNKNQQNIISTNLPQKLHRSINQKGSAIENLIINAVHNLSFLWIILFGIVGICSCVIVFYWPRLQLPESQDFRLFVNDHPFELYDTKYKDQFWFEKSVPSIDNFKLPLRFVWGILPIDNGDYTDPYSKGDLFFDNNFNLSTIKSQEWLLNFCKRLKQQPFYQATFGLLLPNCFIENFISWMNRRCIDTMDNVDRTPCCEISKFPFESYVFDYCLPKSITSLYATPREFFIPGVAGPKFARRTNKTLSSFENTSNISTNNNNNNINLLPIVKALVIEYESNISYSMSYSDMKNFTITVETWFNEELKNAPSEMKGGWFISELDFYDLQDSLTNGTLSAIIIAMAISLIVLFMVTLNVLVSIYAAITVLLTILTTIAILILLEWKLNILESVSVSTAIGLAVDFSLHYGIQYRLSSNTDRITATKFSLSRIIGPTAMAAITTGFAGALMLPSNILPYIQIGIFLVVIMTVSWSYATFFLMSILRIIGPQYEFLQFDYPEFKYTKNLTCNNAVVNNRLERRTTVSDHLLTPSNSAIAELMNSESHELDSLTSNSLIKQVTINNISDNQRPNDNYDNNIHCKINIYKDYGSPSNESANTIVLPDDDHLHHSS